MRDFEQVSLELAKYDAVFADKPRWLVLNKMDTLTTEDGATLEQNITTAIGWLGPVYRISAETGMGTEQLCHDIMQALERMDEEADYH